MSINVKKENVIIIFYVLYFTWIFTVTYLTPDVKLLNIFTLGVLLFYFVFLREKGDIFWFIGASTIGAMSMVGSFSGWSFDINWELLRITPLWLPLSWGVTILALRKFYNILNVRIR